MVGKTCDNHCHCTRLLVADDQHWLRKSLDDLSRCWPTNAFAKRRFRLSNAQHLVLFDSRGDSSSVTSSIY